MKTVVSDFLDLVGWTVWSIPIIWIGMIYVWDQVIGEREAGANLIITGLVVVWTVALSLWS